MTADRAGPRVAVGVMARAPLAGRCKTRLVGGVIDAVAAASLYGAMLEDSLAAFAKLPAKRHVLLVAPEDDGVEAIRRFVHPPWEIMAQQGEGLGARLAHAFTRLGEAGDAVVLLDSDSPTVSIAPIATALDGLDASGSAAGSLGERVLLGPCDDGGYYLVGLSRVTPKSLAILHDIPWSTDQVLARTLERCRQLSLVPLTLSIPR